MSSPIFDFKSSLASSMASSDRSSSHANGDADGSHCPDSDKPFAADWQAQVRHGGSLRHVELETGVNGWACPPGRLFQVRGTGYFFKKHKTASDESLLKPLGVDWLRSHRKLDHALARDDNRVMEALRRANARGQSLKSFVFAVNLQIPGRDYHHAIFYFVLDEPIPHGSLLHRFVHEDDAFRNNRFKLVNRIVKGPWIVRATVGNYAACLLSRALSCNYCKGSNYFEIDVDISSSALANAILHLALGYVSSVAVDMAFLIEAQTEDELPERILGAVRIAQIEMSSAVLVEDHVDDTNTTKAPHGFVRESSWKRFSRSISFLSQSSKSFKDKESFAG